MVIIYQYEHYKHNELLIIFIYIIFLMKEDEKYTNLLNWALSHNAYQNKIEIRYITKDNRYVVAVEDIMVSFYN